MTTERTDRIIETIQSMRARIEPMRKGSMMIDFANGRLTVHLTEVFEPYSSQSPVIELRQRGT